MKIFLIGFMGSGKSTIAILLAKQLKMKTVDLDGLIEAKMNKSINQIFDEVGEKGFRIIEREVLESLKDVKNTVVACGGGTPCSRKNIRFLKDNGTVIYLKTYNTDLLKRLSTKSSIAARPLLQGLSKTAIAKLICSKMEGRRKFYEQAHHIVLNNTTPNKMVKKIVGWIRED
jgi:shikimate kinase